MTVYVHLLVISTLLMGSLRAAPAPDTNFAGSSITSDDRGTKSSHIVGTIPDGSGGVGVSSTRTGGGPNGGGVTIVTSSGPGGNYRGGGGGFTGTSVSSGGGGGGGGGGSYGGGSSYGNGGGGTFFSGSSSSDNGNTVGIFSRGGPGGMQHTVFGPNGARTYNQPNTYAPSYTYPFMPGYYNDYYDYYSGYGNNNNIGMGRFGGGGVGVSVPGATAVASPFGGAGSFAGSSAGGIGSFAGSGGGSPDYYG